VCSSWIMILHHHVLMIVSIALVHDINTKVISDVDNMWLVRIIVVVIISVGSSLGIFKVFQFDLCGAVVAKEIVSDNEIRRRKKFLF